jgi:hypothetical protein
MPIFDMQYSYNQNGFEMDNYPPCDNCNTKATLILIPLEGLTEIRLCNKHIIELKTLLNGINID